MNETCVMHLGYVLSDYHAALLKSPQETRIRVCKHWDDTLRFVILIVFNISGCKLRLMIRDHITADSFTRVLHQVIMATCESKHTVRSV